MLQIGGIDKALSFGGWPGLILLLIGNLSGFLLWLMNVANRNYKKALFLLIMLFPFTFYAGRAAGILVYANEGFDQRIGPTTALLFGLAIALALSRRLRRPVNESGRILEYLMWAFSITITISQLMSHDIVAAILLSIGAAWQFLALFYILISLIENGKDVVDLLNAFFIFSILNILVRVVAKGEPLIVSLSSETVGDSLAVGSEAGRVGSGALGFAVSYACYLAMFITLAIGMYGLTKKKIYLLYSVVVFAELLNTFTMGGIFVLFVLGLLFFFKSTRWSVIRVGFVASLLVIPAFSLITRYLAVRGLTLNIFEIGNFNTRMELIPLYFSDYYAFTLWGVGILKGTLIQLRPWLIVPVHNAYLEVLDTCGPMAAILFAVISIYSIYLWLRICVRKNLPINQRSPFVLLAPFFLVTVVQWVIFANTTSTSILAYYPYEGTALFWIICFLAPVFSARLSARNEFGR